MPERLRYHLEPRRGWMNDPNGLVWFRGRYHAFFQHNPYAPRWDTMHWGHAVSDDLLHWEELPIALAPDQWYESGGGCFSGSAVVREGRLYLFYTGDMGGGREAQCAAWSDDGLRFEKYARNPVIPQAPNGSADFRDPKVTQIGGAYYMVTGSGAGGAGQVLLHRSHNLLDWEYRGVLLEGARYGPVIECPDFFPLGGGFVLMFSQMNRPLRSAMFVYGDFDGETFTPKSEHTPLIGPHFYAPQTFLDSRGRRILIGWMYSWKKELDQGADYAGALSIPMELRWEEGRPRVFPVEEARHLLCGNDPLLRAGPDFAELAADCEPPLRFEGAVRDIHVLRDTKTIEVFLNGGEAVFTYWFGT